MKTLFEQQGGIYQNQGNYFIPCVTIKEPEDLPVDVWANRHRQYLKQYHSIGVQGAIRLRPWKFTHFLRNPQSAYVQYTSIVCLENGRISDGRGRRVRNSPICAPARHLSDAYWTYAEGK